MTVIGVSAPEEWREEGSDDDKSNKRDYVILAGDLSWRVVNTPTNKAARKVGQRTTNINGTTMTLLCYSTTFGSHHDTEKDLSFLRQNDYTNCTPVHDIYLL